MKNLTVNLALLISALAISLLIGEAMSRILLEPGDHLNLSITPDDKLKHRIPDGAQGYDEWGYRNASVPQRTDIVTIGDSQTFGINAAMGKTWPDQLASMTGRQVYNMSVGGYGPVQYYHLFKNKALELEPDQIVIGYYIGNDLLDAFEMAYHFDNWKEFRDPVFESWLESAPSDTLDYYLSFDLFGTPEESFMAGFRGWLSHNSMLYRLIFHGPIISEMKRQLGWGLDQEHSLHYVDVTIPEENIDEGFTPIHRAHMTDMNNPKIIEGFRVTTQIFEQMHHETEKRGIDLTILFIPTKELVYSEILMSHPEINKREVFEKLIRNEQHIRSLSMNWLEDKQIPYVDALPTLQQKAGNDVRIYPPTYDDHPNPKGYEVIARTVYDFIGKDEGRFLTTD